MPLNGPWAAALAALLALIVSGSAAQQENLPTLKNATELLQECYNHYYDPTPTTFESFMAGSPVSLRLRRVWWSRKSTRIPLTIFTTATLDRLDMLESQCLAYPGGPHVGAVYLPVVQNTGGETLTTANELAISGAESKVQALFDRIELLPRACHMRVLLLYEVTSDPAMLFLTPINALRNAALLATRTPLVAMIDVDLRISRSLVDFISDGQQASSLISAAAETFWVLPAWDVSHNLAGQEAEAAAQSALSGGKLNLAKLWVSSKIIWFGQFYFQLGHLPTNHTRWLLQNAAYSIDYAVGYEPWGIIRRDRLAVLPYDARFRGCYNDKITHVVTLHHAHVKFWAFPNAWVVHVPHALNAAAAIGKGVPHDTARQDGVEALQEVVTLYGKNQSKFEHHKEWSHVLLDESIVRMIGGNYRPFPARQYVYCRSVLPWFASVRRQVATEGVGK